jgi:hypothetical protein
MATLSWFIAITAISFQLLNLKYLFSSAFKGRFQSQVHIVPCLLWFLAVAVRGEPFFLNTKAGELLAVVLIHVFLSMLLPYLLEKPPQ